MAISETDLKLLKSERMTDYTDGGGKMTGNEVADGLVNNIFNDISQLDRTYGRVSLRKTYLAVQTANTDTYLGAHVVLTDPPDDQNVNVTLFSTASWIDERSAARNRIESYSVQGPESDWVLYSDHVEGQKMIRCFSLSNATSLLSPAPVESLQVGDVILLSQEKVGYTAQQQFLRITKIDSRETHLYTDNGGNFYKDVLIFEVSNALTAKYSGAEMTRLSVHGSPTLVRTVSVADAAQYFGVKKITQALALSDMTINVNSPYSALVPSAQAEVPLVDIVAGMNKVNIKQAGASSGLSQSASLAGSVAPEYEDDLYMGRGFLPWSLALTIGGVAYKDDGAGNLVLANGSAGSYGGVAVYASGHIKITKASSWSAAVTASATAAVALYDNAGTVDIPVTINNRSFNYVQTLDPAPTPNSLSVDFKALDKWYRLTDDGDGHLSGASSGVGAGTVDYATGSVIVTLGALPDVNSSIIFSWATPLTYRMRTGLIPVPQIRTTLTAAPVVPGSLAITWTNSGAKTATDAAANGVISGDATGYINYATGEIIFAPALIPPPATVFGLAWNLVGTPESIKQDIFSVTGDSFGVVEFTLTQTPVKPGSVSFAYQVLVPIGDSGFISGLGGFALPNVNQVRSVRDNGGGVIINEAGASIGTIDYGTGAVAFDSTEAVWTNKYVGMSQGTEGGTRRVPPLGMYSWMIDPPVGTYIGFEITQTLPGNTVLTARYAVTADPPTPATGSVTGPDVTIDLTNATSDDIIAGSVHFTFGGASYIDRSGSVYRAHSNLTDSATEAGSIDYQTGLVTLFDWVPGANAITLLGMVTTPGAAYTTAVFFRTPGAPLATGQFQINATTRNGENITASADNNGLIISEWIFGNIDWLSGVGSVLFGKMLLDSSLPAAAKAETWYNVDNIGEDGKIWCPMLVKPETIKFNSVLVSYIPLDASVLGVETVRLPQDGRVPIYRVGNVGVVHNTQDLAISNPAIAGSVHNCGRTLLSYAKLFDANGLIVPTAKYTTNLDAGTVTLADPLDLTGYVQPMRIEHRIEDMALITDVQITGEVQFMKPVRHAYPANTSFLSSALVISDLQGRVANLFDQATWASVFSDTQGTPATASFNNVLYPLLVTNAGTIQERWALVFTGSTAFSCYGEYSGLVAQGTTGTDFEPVNPITSVPYFKVNYHGWGTGWAAGNVLRFNTIAANYPLWLARTTLQSDPAVYSDNFKIQIRGDAN